jgi:transposase
MLRKAWVFVMVLAFSRRMVARIVFDQKIETWLRVHVEAFAELGGAPATIVPDNLKAAVIRAAFGVDGAASLEPQLPRARATSRDQDRPRTDLRAEEEGEGRVEREVRQGELLRRTISMSTMPGRFRARLEHDE